MPTGDIRDGFAEVYRDREVDGNPLSARRKPPKAEIRGLGVTIEARVANVESIAVAGVRRLSPVRVATTANGTWATAFDNGSTIDGVVIATGNRILIKDQTAPAENGVYVVQASGAPVRATDADTAGEIGSSAAYVQAGTANIGRTFQCQQAAADITLNTTGLTFVEVGNEAAYSPRLDAAEADILALAAHVDDVEADRIAADTAEATARAAADTAEATARAAADLLLAPKASPVFTGNPTAPTQSVSDDSDKIATTAFVHDAIDAIQGQIAELAEIIQPTAPAGWAWVVKAPAGQIPVGLRETGEMEIAWASPKVFSGASGKAVRELVIPRPIIIGDCILWISYGQSLSLGHGTGAPISTANEYYGAQMFNAGPRAWSAGNGASDYASLVPYKEIQQTTYGESPLYGAMEMIGYRLQTESGGTPQEMGLTFIGEACGENSQSINSLKTGTYFNRIITATSEALDIAKAANQSLRVGAVFFTQGEADDLTTTTIAEWQTRFGEFRTNLLAGVAGVIPAQTVVPIIMYQTASHQQSGLTAPKTALAQLAVARAGAANKVFMACPAYIFKYTDQYHLTPDSSQEMGAFYGLCAKRVVFDGTVWQHLDYDSHEFAIGSGGFRNVVIVKFKVPHPPIDFSTELVNAVANRGLTMVQPATETAINILSVTRVGVDRLKIVTTASADIPNGARLRNAWIGTSGTGRETGPRSNICDSMNEVIAYKSEATGAMVVKRLRNYLPMMEIAL